MHFVRRPLLILSSVLVAATVLPIEPAVRRDVSGGDGSQRFTIGAVRVPLWSAAFAQGAGTVNLENVRLTLGPSTYTAPRIAFSGLASTAAEIQGLFDGASGEPLGARLAKISAQRVAIPELFVDEQLGPVRQRTVYRNLIAQDVERGRIRLATAEGASTDVTGPTSRGTITHGRMSAEDTDLAVMTRLYTEKAGPQPAPLTKVQGSISGENVTYSEDGVVTLKVARYALHDLAMRPTEESWAGTTSLLSAMTEIDQPSDEDTKRMLTAVLDAADGMSVGFAEATGLELNGVAKLEVGGPAKDEAFTVRINRIAYRSAAADKPADARMEGLELIVPDGSAKMESVSYTGFSFQPTLQGLRALRGKPFEQLDAADLRSLIPTVGTIRHSGVVVDLPNKEREGGQPDRIRLSLKEAEVTAEKPLNGIPTEVRLAVRNLALPVPADLADENLKSIAGLGYKAVDVSGTVSLAWNEAGKEILLREVSFAGAEMGQVSLSGVIGGVTRDVFNPDTAVAVVALLGATARSADLTVENTGLFDRYLREEARKLKKTPEALRREYGAAAAFAVPLMLGNSDQAKVVGQSIARFIAKPTRLRIRAQARDSGGLGIAEMVGGLDPVALLEKLEITATTDERL